MDGGNRQVMVTGAGEPGSIAIYGEYVYWVSDGWVERADRFTDLNHEVIYSTDGYTYNIRVNHPSKQPTGWYTTHTPTSTTPTINRLVYNTYHHVNHPNNQQVGMQYISPCQPHQQPTGWYTTHTTMSTTPTINRLVCNIYLHVNHISSRQVGIQHIPPCQPPQQSKG